METESAWSQNPRSVSQGKVSRGQTKIRTLMIALNIYNTQDTGEKFRSKVSMKLGRQVHFGYLKLK